MNRHVPSKAVGSIRPAANVHVIVRCPSLGETEDGSQVVPHDEMMMTLGPSATRQRLDNEGRRVALEKGDVTMFFYFFAATTFPRVPTSRACGMSSKPSLEVSCNPSARSRCLPRTAQGPRSLERSLQAPRPWTTSCDQEADVTPKPHGDAS